MIDAARLADFERDLEPWKAVEPSADLQILGFGEISTVFALGKDDGIAYKRMPLFTTMEQAEAYAAGYRRYVAFLCEAGLDLPEDETAVIGLPGRPVVLYIAQRRLPRQRFCNALLHAQDRAAARGILEAVAERISRVWTFNELRKPGVEIAIDGQLSNWVLMEDGRLLFVDTSTPIFRLDGREQLDPELFLASAPAFLRWLLRLAFLDEVMSRYYEPRRVFMDLAANLYKEQLAELVPDVLDAVNGRLGGKAPLTAAEVGKYYSGDRVIWSVFLAFRRFDRWVKTRIAGRRYEFVLPGKIRR